MLSSHSHWWEACFQIYSGKRSSGKKNAKLYLFCPVFFFFKYNKFNNMKFKKKKESACNAADLGSIPGLGRCPGGGHGNPRQYFCLEIPHGQRCLVGYSPWDHKESDTTEWLSTAHLFYKGWNGVGGGRKAQWESTYVYLWLIHVNVWPKLKQYCKAITLQLKINIF